MNRRGILGLLAASSAGLAVAVPGPASAAEGAGTQLPAQPLGGALMFLGGCIRLESVRQGPYLHHNSAHVAAGITGLALGPDGEVRVDLQTREDGTAYPIVSGFVDEDETFASAGYSAGFSGGTGHARIFFARNGKRVSARSASVYGPGRNLWVGFIAVA